MRRLRLLTCIVSLFLSLSWLVEPAMAQTQPAPSGGSSFNLSDCLSGTGYSYQQGFTLCAPKKTLQDDIAAAKTTVSSLGCWACQVFNAFGTQVFVRGQAVSQRADGSLKPLIVSIATLFALFHLGSAFVSGDAGDLLGRWKVFWRLCMAVALGTAWMSAGSFNVTWKYVYGPLMAIPLAVEKAVDMPGIDKSTCNPAPSVVGVPNGAQGVVAEMGNVVCGANDISQTGIATGIALMNTGDGLIGTLGNMVGGIILIIIFAWITITFPLRFIDVMLRLMVVGIVTPVLVVCAVFKPTRSYVQVAIKNVLYAGCLFAFTGIMFKLGYSFLHEMLDQSGAAGSTGSGMVSAVGNGTAGQLFGRGIVLAGSGVIFSAMIRMAPALAAEFSGFSGSSGGVGDAAVGFASSVATMPVKAGGAVAGGMAARSAVSAASAGVEAGAARGAASALGRGVT